MALTFCFLIYIMDILTWTPLLLGIKKLNVLVFAGPQGLCGNGGVEEKEKNSKNA